MGADLCGFLVKIPAKITQKQKKEALKAANAAVLQAAKALADEDLTKLKYDENYAEEIAKLDPEKFVKSFLEFISEGGYRDTSWRKDPDDPKTILLFAGEMTWGDEPQGGGYQELAIAERLGLWEALGIR